MLAVLGRGRRWTLTRVVAAAVETRAFQRGRKRAKNARDRRTSKVW